jgi:hypothetical protein
MQPDPDDSAAPEFENYIAKIVREILDAERGDNFAAACALINTATILAQDDMAFRTALAQYMTKVAADLDPDCNCGVVRWQ